MKFKNLRTILLAGTAVLMLTLTGCGSSTTSGTAILEMADGEAVIDEAPEWVQELYEAILKEDLDTVYEVIEAGAFFESLTEYDDGETFACYAVDEANVILLYTYDAKGLVESAVAVVKAEEIKGDETLKEFGSLMSDADLCIDSFTYNDDFSRTATLYNTYIVDYGLDSEAVYETSEDGQ